MDSTCKGRCNQVQDLSPEVRSHLSDTAARTCMDAYNQAYNGSQDVVQAEQAGWEAVHQQYAEDNQGVGSKAKVPA